MVSFCYSKTTTREVIVALLRKFKVVDNPQKFALYERAYDQESTKGIKLKKYILKILRHFYWVELFYVCCCYKLRMVKYNH